ncbi:MAG: hypothetical protein LBB48_05125 [Treponema sp.]|nr:hypothetical protein [Treponema sp.]
MSQKSGRLREHGAEGDPAVFFGRAAEGKGLRRERPLRGNSAANPVQTGRGCETNAARRHLQRSVDKSEESN